MIVGESAFIENMGDEWILTKSIDELTFLTSQYLCFRELQFTLTDILATLIHLLEKLANWEIGSLTQRIEP